MEISKRVEKFISDCTRSCSNELIAVESRAGKEVVSYHDWLTPDQARRAVEIAREETYNKIWNWLAKHINDYVVEGNGRDIDLMFDDIKQAMKDE
jgi:hypothetical protein